jgi:protein-disulfide isomerase
MTKERDSNNKPIIKGASMIGAFTLLPARPGTCPECAVLHEAGEPHNQQSLYYQYHFFAEHGRWPTWSDALAHCDEATKEFWGQELSKKGVDVK